MYNKVGERSVIFSIADDEAKLNVVKGMSLVSIGNGDKVDYLMSSMHPSYSSYHDDRGIYFTRTTNFSITDADSKLNVVISLVMVGIEKKSTTVYHVGTQ